jgi:hypothetical protein
LSWNDLLGVDLGVLLSSQLKCTHLIPAKVPLLEEVIFNENQAAAEKRRAAHKAQHKKRQIAKRDRNDNRTKRRKAGELGVSSDEDPSPEPSSLPPRGAEVPSSHRPQAARRDKTVGSSSHQAPPPARVE